MCNCEKTYVEGYVKGLDLDKSSDFTKAISEIAKFESTLSCKIDNLERQLAVLKSNLECCLNSCSCSDCCCCDELNCTCPDSCSCKIECKNCGAVNHVPSRCNCDDGCCSSSSDDSNCCCD